MQETNLVFLSEFLPYMKPYCDQSAPIANNGKADDLYLNLKGVLHLGRFLGLIPLSGFKSASCLKFRWKSSWVGLAILALIAMGVNGTLSCIEFVKLCAQSSGDTNIIEVAIASRHLFLRVFGFVIYLYFLLSTKKFTTLLKTWKYISFGLIFKSEDVHLSKSIKKLSLILLTTMLIGDIMFSCTLFPILERTTAELLQEENFTIWETFAWRSEQIRQQSMSNGFVIIFQFLTNKLAYYSRTYMDLLIILFCRALSHKFQAHVQKVSEIQKSENVKLFKAVKGYWIQVRRDHLSLWKLTDEVEGFFSPLIFMSFAMNTYSLCLDIHEALAPTRPHNSIEMVYSAWSFVRLFMRLGMVTYYGAKVNDAAHSIVACVQECSSEEYSTEMERLENYLRTRIVGLTGLNCFVLTRAFVLVSLSVLFTLEVVLIQASAAARAVV